MSRKLRSVVVAIAFANLLVSAAFAQNRPSHPAPTQTAGVWEWLVGMFVPTVSTVRTSGRGMVAKAGSHMDPDGELLSGSNYSGLTTDAGSQMDPNGIK
jgi:hypothetical protein